MPAAVVTITPGYLPPDGTPITCAILRQLAQPTATANFTIPPATLNFLYNGNFNKTLWSNLSGLSVVSPNTEGMQLLNAQGWTAIATPNGAGNTLTVLPSTDVPNQQSYYSMEIDGTSAGFTAMGFYEQIPSDISAILEGQQVTLSFWIKNLQSGTFTPNVNFVSPNVQDLFSGAMTNIASSGLQTVSQGTWTKMLATVMLSNALVNNGLQVEIDFPPAPLTALSGGVVQFRISQMFLQIGNVSTAFQSDPGLIADIPTPQQARILFGPTGSVVATMNGDMQVWQRNTTFSGINGTKVVDRYKIGSGMSSGTATISSRAVEFPAMTNQYPHTKIAARITVTNAQTVLGGSEIYLFTQNIERQFARALFDGTTSLSLVLQSSVVGVFCVSIQSNSGGNAIVYECPVGVANIPIRFTFPNIPAMPATAPGGNWGTADTDPCYSVTVAAACGTTFQAPGIASWQAGSYYASSNQANLFATLGNTLDITLLQHEAGPVCTPFLWKDFQARQRNCQRYFFKTYPYATVPGTVISAGGFQGVWLTTTNFEVFGGAYAAGMRVSPTITTWDTLGHAAGMNNLSSGASSIGTSAYNLTETALSNFTTVAQTAGQFGFFLMQADAEL